MRVIGFSEKLCWLFLSFMSLSIQTKYFLFLIVLFALRYKLTYRDISLVRERLSSFIYSPSCGVISSIDSDDDYHYLKMVLFPIIGDLVLSPGKFTVKKSNALENQCNRISLVLEKKQDNTDFSLELVPFLRNNTARTNLLKNDIVNEDSVVTEALLGTT